MHYALYQDTEIPRDSEDKRKQKPLPNRKEKLQIGEKGETAKGKKKPRCWSFLLNGRVKLSGYFFCSSYVSALLPLPVWYSHPSHLLGISSGVGFPDDSVPFASLLQFGAVCMHAFPPMDPE